MLVGTYPSMQTNLPKLVFHKDSDFLVEYQLYGEHVILHCTVDRFKLSVLKKMYEVFALMKKEFGEKGFKYMTTITPNVKFCELFNGVADEHTKMIYENKEYEVVRWVLKQQ